MADVINKPVAIANIVLGSIRKGLDPFAVGAVAMAEGLGGGIGDNGSSFGPFQLHVGGAFPTNVNGESTAGWSAQQRHQWAWSPSGIEYALNRISSVASGLKGDQAVSAIVSRFERPADPNAEIGRAQIYYRSLYKQAGGSPAKLPAVLQDAPTGPGGVSGAVDTAVDTAKSTVNTTVDAAQSVGSFLGKITDPDNLIRAGQLVAGAVLILLGVYLLARQIGLPSPPTVAPVRKAAERVSSP